MGTLHERGEQFSFAQDNLASAPYRWLDTWAVADYPSYASLHQPGYGYQQTVIDASYKIKVINNLTITPSLSFSILDYERSSFDSTKSTYWDLNDREEEYLARILANWTINSQHQLALGAELSFMQFGLANPDAPGDQAVLAPWVEPPYKGVSPQWDTNTLSVFGEHQWRINKQWTNFLSLRMDKNTYTEPLYSPRLAIVYTPDEINTFKLMLTKSLRMTFAEEMRWQWEHNGTTSDPEELKSVELRYERQQTPHLLLAGNVFYHELNVIAWDAGEYSVEFDSGTTKAGQMQTWGVELELQYRRKPWTVNLSHGYTKPLNFDVRNDAITVLTAEPYGYGNDLANWSNPYHKAGCRLRFRLQVATRWFNQDVLGISGC
jgi:outer membrane receptor for ferrienterochelin and colicins